LRYFQFGRASAPTVPHFVHAMRGPDGTVRSRRWSTFMMVAAIAAAVSSGGVTPAEATDLARLVEVYVRAVEASEFEARLAALEENQQPERAR
jgi:hypothetical protein